MDQKEFNINLHEQLKEAAQRIFAGLKINPGNYTPKTVDKILNLSGRMDEIASARRESRERPEAAGRYEVRINSVISDLETIGLTAGNVSISLDTFTASMPAPLVFAKLAQWETDFSIPSAARAKFAKEPEGNVIYSCVVDFPKEAKYIAEYAGTDIVRPVMMGVCLDYKNNCLVASDTRVLTEIPAVITPLEGEPVKLLLDPAAVKAVAGQRCTIKLFDRKDDNVCIRTENDDILICTNIKGNYPDYRRVYPKVNREGLVELTKEGIKGLVNFLKGTIKQTKDKRDGSTLIKIEIPAYSASGTATYFDLDYQREKKITFAVKGSPKVDVCFGIHAFHFGIVTKNWNGCFWYLEPSRAIVFDNINTGCTVAMPMQLLDRTDITPGHCAGVVPAVSRHNYDAALAEIRQQQANKAAESASIPKSEKEECAKRYCSIKRAEFERLTEKDEIIAVTLNGCRARYVGKFHRSGEIVLFDCEQNFISFPEIEDTKPETQPATPDYTAIADNLCNMLELIRDTMTAAKTVLEVYYETSLIEPLTGSLELLERLGAIVAMSAKALEIEKLAEGANIDLDHAPAPTSAPTRPEPGTTGITSPPAPTIEATPAKPVKAPAWSVTDPTATILYIPLAGYIPTPRNALTWPRIALHRATRPHRPKAVTHIDTVGANSNIEPPGNSFTGVDPPA